MRPSDPILHVEARAPGKIILSGEHSVVHGYAAVAASVGLFTRCNIRLAGVDDVVSLHLIDLNLRLQWPLHAVKSVVELVNSKGTRSTSDSADITAKLQSLVDTTTLPEAKLGVADGVIAFLFMYTSILGSQPSTVTITSELPLGSGLGSSASFCVSLAAGLLAMAKMLDTGCEESQTCEDSRNNGVRKLLTVDEAGLELINKWAFEGEKIIHGRPSGIDNTVCTFGQFVKFRKGQFQRLQASVPLKMLVTNTKVGRNTKALVAGVGERALRHPKAMTAVFEAIDAIAEEIADILQSVSNCKTSSNELETKLEELVEMNQGLLQCMGVSHPSIETICGTTLKYHLHSKLTGAGGGGCVLTLIPEQVTSKTLNKVKSNLEAEGYDSFETVVGGPGVQVAIVL